MRRWSISTTTIYNGEPVRVAVLLQPVAGGQGGGMATIQVAETLELRQALARQILIDTLWRQALLVLVISGVVLWVVQRATRPVRELSQRMLQRGEHDLAPIGTQDAPRELLPLVAATNQVMARLAHLLADQKRFVRDTAHQLRTPLAVLRTQLQSAQRGDVAPAQALQEMQGTVERATVLANQMLSLAKVEQLRQQGGAPVLDWAEITRAVALDLAPLIAQAGQDFEHRHHARAGARARVGAARADAQPAAQRPQVQPADGPAGGAAGHSRRRGPAAHRRRRAGHRARAAPAPVPALRRRRPAQRLGPGPGHLPGDRGLARRRHPARQPAAGRRGGRPGRRGLAAAGRQSGVMSSPSPDAAGMRLDKWLWAARFYKTRGLAVEAIDKGRVAVNGQPAKRSRELRVGDRVALRQGERGEIAARGAGAGAEHGARPGASGAAAVRRNRRRAWPRARPRPEPRALQPEPAHAIEQGRPTKRDRRRLADWQRWSASADDLER